MKSNYEIRRAARNALGGNIFGHSWMTALVAVVVYTVLVSVLSYVAIGILLAGPLTVGLAAFFLKAVRTGERADVANMFHTFKSGDRFMHTLILGLLTYLFTFLWSLLFFIPGIIKSYAYALAPYIALEREDLDARECLAESQRLMMGHKWQLFTLDLSFLGWYIVGLLCCCIGIYFVDPYHHAARAAFYCALVAGPEVVADVQAEDTPEN